MAMAPAITLKRMYHWVPSSMSKTAARDSPPGRPTSARSNTGKSAVAGMEAITCTTGCKRRDQRGERPMATPTGTVQATPTSKATRVRSQVASEATSRVPQVTTGTWTTSTGRRKSFSSLGSQGLALIGPLEGFSHGAVIVVDEGEHFVL